jgi:hypothetical protein
MACTKILLRFIMLVCGLLFVRTEIILWMTEPLKPPGHGSLNWMTNK